MLNDRSDKRLALGEAMSKTLAGIDVADPAQRTAAALFVVLKNQLESAWGTIPARFRSTSGSARKRAAAR